MNEELYESLFLEAVSVEVGLQRNDARSELSRWFTPCSCLMRLSTSKRLTILETVVSKQEAVRNKREQHLEDRFCRILVYLLLHIDEDSIRQRAFEYVCERLEPTILNRNLEPGRCDCFCLNDGGDMCNNGYPDPDADIRVLSALHLIGRIHLPWMHVLLVALYEGLTHCYAWITYSASMFPESYWLWAERMLSGEKLYVSIAMQITLTLCLNHNFARDAIRHGIFDKCLEAAKVYQYRETLPPPDHSDIWCGNDIRLVHHAWHLFLTKHITSAAMASILCIIAALELPEVTRDHQLKIVEAAIECGKFHERVRRTLSFSCFANPKLRVLIIEEGLESSFGHFFSPSWGWHPGCSLGFLSRDKGADILLEVNTKKYVSAASESKKARYAKKVLECLEMAHLEMLCDSFIRSLCDYRTRSTRLTLLHIIAKWGFSYRWWFGVLKRIGVDLNARDSMQRTPLLAVSNFMGAGKLPGCLVFEPDVDLSVRDKNGKGLLEYFRADRLILLATDGDSRLIHSWTKAVAERGVFDTVQHVSLLYENGFGVIPKEIFTEISRMIWISPPRLPGSNAELAKILSGHRKEPLNSLFPCFLLKASFLCSFVVMKSRRAKREASHRRAPIALLTPDILTILFMDHLCLPDLEQQALVKAEEWCFRF